MYFKIKISILFVYFSLSCLANDVKLETEGSLPEPENQEFKNDSTVESLLTNAKTYTSTFLAELFNATLENTTESGGNLNNTQKFVKCISAGTSEVHLLNDTELMKLLLPSVNVTSREIPAPCILVLFYSKYCPFSSMAAPHFNALPRAFPDIKMVAINAMMYHLFNTQNGIVGVPSLLLFHNGKPVAKFNESEYSLELFSKFLTKHTGIAAEKKSHVTSADFSGPISSMPSKDSDPFLILSWLFIIICSIYYFMKSWWWKWIVETIQSNWRESAQHVHNE